MSVYEDALEVAAEAHAQEIQERNGVTWISETHMEFIRAHAAIGVNALRDAGLLREDGATPNE